MEPGVMAEITGAAERTAGLEHPGDEARPAALAATQTVRTSPSVWRRFRRHRLAMVGLAVLVVLVFLAVFAPLIAEHMPQAIDLSAYRLGPSADHPLGTD